MRFEEKLQKVVINVIIVLNLSKKFCEILAQNDSTYKNESKMQKEFFSYELWFTRKMSLKIRCARDFTFKLDFLGNEDTYGKISFYIFGSFF